MTITMPYAQCYGADLYYEDQGEGTSIFLLHGVLRSLRVFDLQLAGLSDEHLTVAFAENLGATDR